MISFAMHTYHPTLGAVALSLGSCLLSPLAQAQAPSGILPPRTDIIAKCVLANDYWIATATAESNSWDVGAYYTGNQRFVEVLDSSIPSEAAKRTSYLNRALTWAAGQKWQCKINSSNLRDPDSHTSGQTYIDLYRLDPQSVRLAGVDGVNGIKPRIDSICNLGTTSDGDWSWVDTFYMAAPVFARLDQTIGDTPRDYSAKLKTMYLYMKDTRGLFDVNYGLWYRDATAKSATTPNNKKELWSRGNGWVIGGLVRVLDELGPTHPDRPVYASMLQTMSAALIPLQQSDGFWRSSLVEPNQYPNPETSGTAFITYAMAWGINNGLLDAATYGPVVAKAWNGMVQTALHPDGKLGYVQQVARAPGVATYADTKNYAVGAFMLAGSELSLMAEITTPPTPPTPSAGVDQTWYDFDGDGSVMVTLDGSGTLDPDGKAVSYDWYEGMIKIGSGITPDVTLTVGVHNITLRITADDTNTWDDTVRITITTTATQQVYLQNFTVPGTADLSLSAYGWSGLVTQSSQTTDYTSNLVIGVSQLDYAFFAPKGDSPDAVPNTPARAFTTVPGPIHISKLTSIKWLSGADNADHEYRVAIQVGGVWYASNPALNTGMIDTGTTVNIPLSFSPVPFATASNWLAIQNTTLGSTGTLSLGAAPGSNLSGNVTAFGLYLVSGVDNEVAGDHVRWDNFEVWVQVEPPTFSPAISSFFHVSGNQWELILDGTPNASFHFYSSPDLSFNPGTLITSLTQANPSSDRGVVTDGTTLTTDDTGRAKVRLILTGHPADFVRARSIP